jgi:hypothetical protein
MLARKADDAANRYGGAKGKAAPIIVKLKSRAMEVDPLGFAGEDGWWSEKFSEVEADLTS